MIGDILGAAVLNVDELIEMPMGCGEQNVARLFPNVLIYDYLSRFKAGLQRSNASIFKAAQDICEKMLFKTFDIYF